MIFRYVIIALSFHDLNFPISNNHLENNQAEQPRKRQKFDLHTNYELKIDENETKILNEEVGNLAEGNGNKKRLMHEFLLKFQRETGWFHGKLIDWDQMDISQVPSKYEKIIINRHTLRNKKLINNPEIIENIHFRPYSAEELDKKKAHLRSYRWQSFGKRVSQAEIENNEEYKQEYEKLLMKFRLESGDGGATKVQWRLIDKTKLPDEYKNIPFSDKLFYQLGLYKDEKFIENLRFHEYARPRH